MERSNDNEIVNPDDDIKQNVAGGLSKEFLRSLYETEAGDATGTSTLPPVADNWKSGVDDCDEIEPSHTAGDESEGKGLRASEAQKRNLLGKKKPREACKRLLKTSGSNDKVPHSPKKSLGKKRTRAEKKAKNATHPKNRGAKVQPSRGTLVRVACNAGAPRVRHE
ncbi:hypothetical protein FGB62_342g09 [Gracilaria domingensis]|nr:hypothetical protein FGB62_342g09 [Gracilaria domingensis]